MMKFTWLFLINDIWINTCFKHLFNQKKTCFDCLIPYTVIPWNRDIFWDDYHTVKISYRYNPTLQTNELIYEDNELIINWLILLIKQIFTLY